MESKQTQVYKANKIFTGSEWLADHAVVVSAGRIIDVAPSSSIENTSLLEYPILAPAFMDIQIYGAHDKLLAVYPQADSLHKLYDYCSKGGASHFQPTVATNTYQVFYQCIDAVKAYWKEGGKGCIVFRVEGPWINKQQKGAYIASFIHSPYIADAKAILYYGKGVITSIKPVQEHCSKAACA